MSRKERLIPINDSILWRFISANDDQAREAELEVLLTEIATPTIEGVLRRREWHLSAADREEIRSTIQLRLLQKLWGITDDPGEAVRRFGEYVATLTFHAVFDWVRCRFPERARLKSRLRYLLNRNERFAVWLVAGVPVCGRAEWRGRTDYARQPMRLDEADALETAISHCFAAGVPLTLDALTASVAAACRMDERAPEIDLEDCPSAGPLPDERLEQRQFLALLWSEIETLPPNQRTALLLNLRDPQGMNALAVLSAAGGIAPEALAAAMGLAPGELAALWNELPLDDLAIAGRLGLTRQQVINLRKAARARLARRLATHGRQT